MPVTKIDQVIKAFTTLYPIRISYILSIEYDNVLKNEHSLACRRRIIPGLTPFPTVSDSSLSGDSLDWCSESSLNFTGL